MIIPISHVANYLDGHHYLGRAERGFAWSDDDGVMVFANPSSRRLPQQTWVELVRWCIEAGRPNAGSVQFSRVAKFLRQELPEVTTIVSYSDPSAGHTGALYRASNWLWAPTWHRLRTPPSGNGNWGSGKQAVKDRWVYPLRPDDQREGLLSVQDESLMRRMPWASYREPTWPSRARFIGGGGDFKRWKDIAA